MRNNPIEFWLVYGTGVGCVIGLALLARYILRLLLWHEEGID